MTIKTSRRNLAAASADEAAAPHAMPDQAGKGTLSRRHLYMSAAVLALTVAGAGSVQPAKADVIDKTTPTHITNPLSLFDNIPRDGIGGDMLATGSGQAGVDVQVKLQAGYDFFWVA